MVHRADGGAVGDGSEGVGYKLDVKVDSLRVLADQISDDLADFDGQFQSWNQQANYTHPLSAQYSLKEGGTIFEEAYTLDGGNRGSHQQVELGVQLVRKGLEALHKAADNLAKTYQNLDEANAISVARVDWLFPQPPKPDGSKGTQLPSAEELQKHLHPDGFDLDGDGVVDPAKGDILFAPSNGQKPAFTGQKSQNDTPADVRPDSHQGYSTPVDQNKQTQESGGFSDEVREEYQEHVAEEQEEAANTDIVAPGAPGTYPGTQTGTSSGAVTA